MPKRSDPLERFMAKILVDETTGCWLWQSYRDKGGYGRFNPRPDRPVQAHRWSYEQLVGPIPHALTIDYLCRVRHCVNPDHLEAVTNRENVSRGKGPTVINAAKTHCLNGHPYDDENTRVRPQGWRDCRACARERMRRKRTG